jgi:hypothetical protein
MTVRCTVFERRTRCELTLSIDFADPKEPSPVPPRVAASVPVQPAVIDTLLKSADAGVPPNVSVIFVSSTFDNVPAAR